MTAALSPVRPEPTARPSEEQWRVTPRRTAVVITDLFPAETAPPSRPTRCPAPVPPVRRQAVARARPQVVAPEVARRRRVAAAAGLAVASIAVVGAVSGLGQLLPGAAADSAVPAQVTVERVGAGETLWDVAARVAPASDPGVVVERIRELNVIAGTAVVAGQTLRVPDGR